MINLDNLDRQHKNIAEEINFIELQLEKSSSEINTVEVASHINKLAGQLKIHLLDEDKFLYPELLKSQDGETEELAKKYMEEMGGLSQEYTNFKNSYNTSSKINEKRETFIQDGKAIIKALKKRMDKEDTGLYNLIRKKGL